MKTYGWRYVFAVRPLSITTAVQLLGKVPTGDLNVLAKLTPLVGHCKKRQQGSLGFQCALAKILETGMLSQFCLHRTLVTLKSGRRRTNKEQCTFFTGLTHCLMQTEFTASPVYVSLESYTYGSPHVGTAYILESFDKGKT